MDTSPIRLSNLDQRNQKIRDAYFTRYTNVPRTSKPDRGQVLAQLADEYFLRVKTVEKAR